MSGEVYCPALELLQSSFSAVDFTVDSLNLNPLHCLLCQASLNFPVSLSCHHVFCKKCILSRRDKETNRLKCPLCGIDCSVPDSSLTCDPLIKYLIESANEKTDVCANCDKINQPMFFCETCHQPLCVHCKDETHQAKMFATHKIVLHEERCGAGAVKKCKNHGEPYILFCAENKSLVCINCFRTATMESRPHYVDLDTAYKVGCDKLEKIAKQLKCFQKEVQDGILLRRSMLDEIRKSASNEINQIQMLCQQMIDKLIEVRDNLLLGINKESAEREEHFRYQLNFLFGLMPTIQLYLLLVSIFCSSASKMDFLDLCYTLMHRIQSVVNENQCLQPAFTGQIQTNYKAEFARSLEPYLGVKSVLLPAVLQRQLSSTPEGCRSNNNNGDVSPASSVNSSQYCRLGSSKQNLLSQKNYSKLRLLVDLAGAFGDEYGKIDNELKDLHKRFLTVSKRAQDVQRDLTIRRCVIDENKLSEVFALSQTLKVDLGAHSTRVDDLQATFQQIWEEQLDRVRSQQEIYRNHIGSVMVLREDLHRMITASKQLAPFVRSIALAIQQIKPERCPTTDNSPMQQICLQINTLECNSQNRVDAIERQEQQRKQEMERKRLDSSQLLAVAKNKLKTPKDSSRRKSGQDFSSQIVGGVVKNVERDRAGAGDLHMLSPNKIHKAPATAPVSGSSGGGSPRFGKKLLETSGATSLDESFEKILACGVDYGGKPPPLLLSSNDNKRDIDQMGSGIGCLQQNSFSELVVADVAMEAVLLENCHESMVNDCSSVDCNLSDGAIEFDQQPKQQKFLERSVTLGDTLESCNQLDIAYNNFDQNPLQTPLSASLSLPVLVQTFSLEPPPSVGKLSPKSCLPPSLVASVDNATLEARERVLASLKEKVRRVDVGPM